MKIGRNQPCPCGSGKKYKTCCLPLDRRRGGLGETTEPARLVARDADSWQVDFVALPILIDEAPAARSAARLIIINGAPISAEILDQPPFEPEPAARDLADTIVDLARQLEAWPREILVRRPELESLLSAALADHGITVRYQEDLPELEDVAAGLLEHLGANRRPEPLPVLTWAAWRQGDPWTASLFAAAAAFYRAKPWSVLDDSDYLLVGTDQGACWSACVLGQAEMVEGLSLSKERDAFSDLADADEDDPWSAMSGDVYSIIFYEAQELPRAMRREVLRAGWEVASAEAYPNLLTLGTLAGGITGDDALDLVRILAAIPRFLAAEHADEEPWTDPETGYSVMVDPRGLTDEAAVVLDALEPGDAQGRGAEPDARYDFSDEGSQGISEAIEVEVAIVGPYRKHLEATLKPATVRRHAQRAEYVVEYVVGFVGVPLRAIHEYDLRDFLYDHYPRKVCTSVSEARSLLGSLRRFFAFLAASIDLRCPWAEAILADRETFLERVESCPGGPFWDEDLIMWRSDLQSTLETRMMLPDSQLGEDDSWGATMGLAESELFMELCRRWLVWRDEALRSSAGPPIALLPRLFERQRRWELAAQDRFGGQSPLEVIHAERLAAASHSRDAEPGDSRD